MPPFTKFVNIKKGEGGRGGKKGRIERKGNRYQKEGR
jgi:hypothetical protein